MVEHARRVVISHPDELSEWGRQQLDTDRFRTYLRRTRDDLGAGDEWEEFLDTGCCGGTLDVPLRVESVDGPGRMGSETDVEFVEREAEMAGGWEVQSVAGPD